MKYIFYLKLFAICLVGAIAFIVNSCSKLDVENEIKKERISGFVQKGPYVNGTQILMAELNSSMEQTGKLFSTQITDNKGTFEINNIELTSSYVEFSASGFYFDEVKGDISAAQLTLFALSDVTDISSVNVNILTHLERRRVEYLVANGKSFSEAKSQAQKEILAIFGFEKANMKDSENLDISVDNEDNAILLAISVILQGNRSVGDLTELLASISSAIRTTGVLENETIMNQLRSTSLQLNSAEIRQHLVSRYQSLGITANIPDFDTYVGAFLSYTAGEPFALTQDPVDVTPTSAIFTAMVNPNSASTTVSFEYGTTEEYGNIVTFEQDALNGNKGMPVQVAVSSLDPATTYHFRVKAENEHGAYYGLNRSFTTLGEASDAETLSATDITLTSVTLRGVVNPNHLSTTVVFEYGTSTELGSEINAIQSPISGHNQVNVTAELKDLQPGTTYFYRVKAQNDLGVNYANKMEFKTLGDKPTAIVNFASLLGESVLMNGTVNPNYFSTVVSFEWGILGSFENSTQALQSPLTGEDDFTVTAELSNLKSNTLYNFRVRAENELGVTFSHIKNFRTYASTVQDIDGNVYPTIIIGDQEWMAKNLRTTRYNNGDPLQTGSTNCDVIDGEYNVYNNDENLLEIYGALYNWAAVSDERNICPTGWHVPGDEEWTILSDYLGGESVAGGKLKDTRSDYWNSPNVGATNEYGFTALPGGCQLCTNGLFEGLGSWGWWWTSTTHDNPESAWGREIHSNRANLISSAQNTIEMLGLSVRCIKTNPNL